MLQAFGAAARTHLGADPGQSAGQRTPAAAGNLLAAATALPASAASTFAAAPAPATPPPATGEASPSGRLVNANRLRDQLTSLVQRQSQQVDALDGFIGATSPQTAAKHAEDFLRSCAPSVSDIPQQERAGRAVPAAVTPSAGQSRLQGLMSTARSAVSREGGSVVDSPRGEGGLVDAVQQQVAALRAGQGEQAAMASRLAELVPQRIDALRAANGERSLELESQPTDRLVSDLMQVITRNNDASQRLLTTLRQQQQQQQQHPTVGASARSVENSETRGGDESFEGRMMTVHGRCDAADKSARNAMAEASAVIEACETALKALVEDNARLKRELEEERRYRGEDMVPAPVDHAQLRRLTARVQELERERHVLRSDAERQQEHDMGVRADLDEAYQALNTARDAHAELKSALDVERQRARALEAEAVELRNTARRPSPPRHRQGADDSVIQADHEMQAAQLAEARLEVEAWRTRCDELSEECRSLQIERQALRDENARLAREATSATKRAEASGREHQEVPEAGPSFVAGRVLDFARKERTVRDGTGTPTPTRPLPVKSPTTSSGIAGVPVVQRPRLNGSPSPGPGGRAQHQSTLPGAESRTSSAAAVLASAQTLLATVDAKRKTKEDQHRDAVARLRAKREETRALLGDSSEAVEASSAHQMSSAITPAMARELTEATTPRARQAAPHSAGPLPARETAADQRGLPAGRPQPPQQQQSQLQPNTGPKRSSSQVDGVQALVEDLSAQIESLDEQERALNEQQQAILQKRAAVSSTLMAQRNQKLMSGAPDTDVEALNNQISAVMVKIDAATSQVESNLARVQSKRDLLQRQLRAAQEQQQHPRR